MRLILALLWTMFLACTLCAQSLEIKGDTKIVEVPRTVIVLDKVQVVTSLPFSVNAPVGGALYSWSYPATVTATKLGNVLTITAAPKGPLTVSCEWIVIDFEAKKFESKAASLAFAVGEVGPGPKPPDPPSPAPIPVDGFHVLFVIESADSIPASQRVILAAASVRAYLNSKCVLGPDGKTREWRQWDKDTATANESKLWQDVMKRPRTSLPWVVISDGKTGYEGPLPANVAETLTLLKKYGGE